MKKLSDRFYQIKKKHEISAIIKSAVCGISLGLFVTGILLLALKLSAIALAAYWYVLIGLCVASGCGVALFRLRFRPTDKQVAKRTDEDYALNERVQTALEYSEENGTIIELQRADAEERIKSLPVRRFSIARVWQFVVIAFVALAISAAGIAVPARAADDRFVDPDTTPREVTELERAGVRELISNVGASSLSDGLKSSTEEVLEQLLADLDNVNTEGTLRRAVDTAIDGSGKILASTFSYVDIGAALTGADQIYLGQAVTNGGNVYRYYMLTVYDEVRTFDTIKYDASNAKVGKGVTYLRNNLTVSISAGLFEVLGNTSEGIEEALASVSLSENDGLYILIKSFSEGLSEIKSGIGSSEDTVVQSKITDLTSDFIVDVTNEVSTQAYNGAMKVFISNRLKTIFGYSPLELPIVDPDKSEGGPDSSDSDKKDKPDDDKNQSGGSGGTGETEYGSDDMIWVPGRGYVKYGDIIEEYYRLINQYLHSDELTEEQKSMIRAYYDILFGSNKNQ